MNASSRSPEDEGLPRGYQFKPEYELTPRMVKARLDEAPMSVLLIDCRTQPEWDLVHVPGSVHIPLDEIEERAEEARPEPGQVVALICHHGVRSLRAALALRALGVPGAMSVAGGIECWALTADPRLKRYERTGGVCRPLS